MVERAVALGQEGEALQPWNLCGFQTCPYLGGVASGGCGFCAEGLSAETKKPSVAAPVTLATAREAFERDYIVEVLKQVDGNRTKAANVLGLSRKALWDKCKRYGHLLSPEARRRRMTSKLFRRFWPAFPQLHGSIP